MDYSKTLNNLVRTAFKGIQYKKMPVLCKILMVICMAPVIVTDFVLIAIYHVLNFFYKGLSTPVEILHNFLCNERENVRHGTEAVIYYIAFPFIWFSQICLASMSYLFYILWFFIMTTTYIWTLGGIKWQPFITEATPYNIDDYVALPRGRVAQTVFPIITAAFLFISVLFFITANEFLMPILMRTAPMYDNFAIYTFVSTIRVSILLVCLSAHYACIFILNPIIFKIVKVQHVEKADKTEDDTSNHSETITVGIFKPKEVHEIKYDFQTVSKANTEDEELKKREAEERVKLEAEERAKREAEERAKREAEERAKLEAEERAKRVAEALEKDKLFASRLIYALQLKNDDDMIRYLHNIQDETVQSILNEYPDHLIREKITQLLSDL